VKQNALDIAFFNSDETFAKNLQGLWQNNITFCIGLTCSKCTFFLFVLVPSFWFSSLVFGCAKPKLFQHFLGVYSAAKLSKTVVMS